MRCTCQLCLLLACLSHQHFPLAPSHRVHQCQLLPLLGRQSPTSLQLPLQPPVYLVNRINRHRIACAAHSLPSPTMCGYLLLQGISLLRFASLAHCLRPAFQCYQRPRRSEWHQCNHRWTFIKQLGLKTQRKQHTRFPVHNPSLNHNRTPDTLFLYHHPLLVSVKVPKVSPCHRPLVCKRDRSTPCRKPGHLLGLALRRGLRRMHRQQA
mmetsp:Transcript_39085/g.75016  ORF Transcript_39085/g.75016 Transcript_39085/m.75016 type:complete len:209 (-) Transcript_39085:2898-3524(-)